jgi:hypothetical protein
MKLNNNKQIIQHKLYKILNNKKIILKSIKKMGKKLLNVKEEEDEIINSELNQSYRKCIYLPLYCILSH